MPIKRGPKGKHADFTEQETIDLLRDLYLFLEHRVPNRLLKRTLAAARAAGATFGDGWAVDILAPFVQAHHRKRHTSSHGTNGKLNTTKRKRTNNAPGQEHEMHREIPGVDPPSFSMSGRSSRRAVETVENANKRAKAALENGSYSSAREQLEKLEKEWKS